MNRRSFLFAFLVAPFAKLFLPKTPDYLIDWPMSKNFGVFPDHDLFVPPNQLAMLRPREVIVTYVTPDETEHSEKLSFSWSSVEPIDKSPHWTPERILHLKSLSPFPNEPGRRSDRSTYYNSVMNPPLKSFKYPFD